MKKLLKELGFTQVIGFIWVNKDLDISIELSDNPDAGDIVTAIYKAGYHQCQANVRKSIGM